MKGEQVCGHSSRCPILQLMKPINNALDSYIYIYIVYISALKQVATWVGALLFFGLIYIEKVPQMEQIRSVEKRRERR